MSKRRQVLNSLASLSDLRDVFSVMKNLALVEISRISATQRAREHLREELTNIAHEASRLFPDRFSVSKDQGDLYVIIGSERGFCGAFNEPLAAQWQRIVRTRPHDRAILVGMALVQKLENPVGIVASLQGPAIAEDVDAILTQVLQAIGAAQAGRPFPYRVKALSTNTQGVTCTEILPFVPPNDTSLNVLPDMYVRPDTFVRDFVDQYVDAALHEAFCTSLMTENHSRMTHMSSALDRADERAAQLQQRANHLRQEEITETIEAILLAT